MMTTEQLRIYVNAHDAYMSAEPGSKQEKAALEAIVSLRESYNMPAEVQNVVRAAYAAGRKSGHAKGMKDGREIYGDPLKINPGR